MGKPRASGEDNDGLLAKDHFDRMRGSGMYERGKRGADGQEGGDAFVNSERRRSQELRGGPPSQLNPGSSPGERRLLGSSRARRSSLSSMLPEFTGTFTAAVL